jgi:hypothetical protein
MDPNLYTLIQQAISTGITNTQITSAVIAFLAAALGAWIAAYASKKAEFAALREDFQESLDQLRKQTEVVEQTKIQVENLQKEERLAFELQKTRGVERQELRYKSYSSLWQQLRPLAIYDRGAIDREAVGTLSRCLSDWYFSADGGLLLTPQARYFYFALQDLLRQTLKTAGDWEADRSDASEGKEKEILKDILQRFASHGYDGLPGKPVDVLEYIQAADFKDWAQQAPAKGKVWRRGINEVAQKWEELTAAERFAVLQQAGSFLRTSLTNDLESRLG